MHLLPTLWFRNTWSWGREGEGYWPRGVIRAAGAGDPRGRAREPGPLPRSTPSRWTAPRPSSLFTENETNVEPPLRRAELAALREGRVSPRGDPRRAAMR